jgi:ketosteroid isomerase-like protein
MEKLTPLYHDRFVGWDLAQPLPSARAAFMAEEAAFLKSVRSIESKVTPIMIEIAGDTAVVHVTYKNTVVMSNGQQAISTGRWSSTLVKQGGGWLFLSNTYMADK